VRTIVVSDPPPGEFEALLQRRRRWGADHNDEVWAGVLHMNPAPHGRHADVQQQVMELLGPLARAVGLRPLAETNLGDAGDFRVPDGALQRSVASLYYATAALVLEVVSPGDETWEKLSFYACRAVDEVLIVDPQQRAVHWLTLSGSEYRAATHSSLIDLGPDELIARIDWPALED
jgi:Uma2 family endonuclease